MTDVLAWGVCNDSSVLWGILKTTTLDTVEVWTLRYVNYITRKRLCEKNPLWGVILGSPGGPILLEFWKLCYFNKDKDDGKKKKKDIFLISVATSLLDGIQRPGLTSEHRCQGSLTVCYLSLANWLSVSWGSQSVLSFCFVAGDIVSPPQDRFKS